MAGATTIADIAREAGVSTATVSYALRGDSQVRRQTAQKVMEAADRLHYRGNANARSLRLGKSGVVAVAVHNLTLPFSGELASAVSRSLSEKGYQTLVHQTLLVAHTEESLLHDLDQQLCDGTVFCSGGLSSEHIKAIAGSKPMVILDPPRPTDLFDTVYTPSREGSKAVTEHLLRTGCRRIALLGTPYQPYEQCRASADVGQSRLLGCMEACRQADADLDPENVIGLSRWTAKDAYESVSHMIEQGKRFDGLFCLSDTMAVGAIHALFDHGISVPEDVSVAGFDGTNDGAYNTPSLTTVSIDLADLANTMVNLLFARMENPDAGTSSLTARFSLTVRQSSRSRVRG